jgi:predicted nucleotidyltransferase
MVRGLGDLLFGKTRGGILRLLYGRPDRTFYLREIAREIGGSAGSAQRELTTLADIGLIVRSVSGNQVLFQANGGHPVFGELRAMVAKTLGVFQLLHSALAPLAPGISVAFVYGSMARGDETADSDVDLMIIGKVALDDVVRQLTPAEKTIGRALNPTIYPEKEFRTKLKSDNHFLRSVIRAEKVFLIGDKDELEKMGGVRLAQGRADQPRRDQRVTGNHPSRPARRRS